MSRWNGRQTNWLIAGVSISFVAIMAILPASAQTSGGTPSQPAAAPAGSPTSPAAKGESTGQIIGGCIGGALGLFLVFRTLKKKKTDE